MKRLLAFLALVSTAHAVGTVQTNLQQLATNTAGQATGFVVSFVWTGDATNGTVPATTFGLSCCIGFTLTGAEFVPGTPSPTNNYSAVLNDTAGVDALGGAASALSATVPQAFNSGSAVPPVQGSITLVISGQAVAGAKGTVYVFFSRSASGNAVTVTNTPTVTIGNPSAINNTWAGGTLGAMANYGTSPGAVLVPGTNSFITNTPAVTQSGTWTVQPGNTANTTPWLQNVGQFGGVNVSTGTGAGGTGIPRVTVSNDSSLAANQSVNMNQVGGTNVVTGGASGLMAVAGPVASAGSNADNPVKIGGVFNTTQPTVTTGQIVDAQTTARGAQIVATGVDAFAVNATQTGTWTVQPGNTANTTPWLVQGNFANNGSAAATNRIGTLDGIAQTSYNNGTAYTQGRDAAQNIGTDGLLWTAQLPAMRPASYTGSIKFAGSSTTDNSCMPGNASNTVLVTELHVSGVQTTAGILNVEVLKRSAADTGGTPSNITAVPDDANYAAAVSQPVVYTGAGPAVGTAIGDIDNMLIGFLATGTASPNDVYIANWRQKPIVLRGTAQVICVNMGNAAITGGSISLTWKWIETTTIAP